MGNRTRLKAVQNVLVVMNGLNHGHNGDGGKAKKSTLGRFSSCPSELVSTGYLRQVAPANGREGSFLLLCCVVALLRRVVVGGSMRWEGSGGKHARTGYESRCSDAFTGPCVSLQAPAREMEILNWRRSSSINQRLAKWITCLVSVPVTESGLDGGLDWTACLFGWVI